MLSQKKQLYLAIIVLILIGIFFFPSLYKDAKAEHHFCCTSFNGKIIAIRADNENFKFVKLSNGKEYFLGKYLDKDANIEINDSIIKPQGSLIITVYSKHKIKIGNNKKKETICECNANLTSK